MKTWIYAFCVLAIRLINCIDVIEYIWNDDLLYDIRGLNGWNAYYETSTKTYNYTNALPIITGNLSDYHGVYQDTYSTNHFLERTFECTNDSAIKIGFTMGYCGNQQSDFLAVYVDHIVQLHIDFITETRLYLLNDSIVTSAEVCEDVYWVYYNVASATQVQSFIAGGNPFEITIEVKLSQSTDTAVISNITIFCSSNYNSTDSPTPVHTTLFPTTSITTGFPTTNLPTTQNPTTTSQMCYTNLSTSSTNPPKLFFYISNSNTDSILFEMIPESNAEGLPQLAVDLDKKPNGINDDCRPFAPGLDAEQCSFNPTEIGTYYIIVDIFAGTPYTGVTLCGPIGFLPFSDTTMPTTASPTTTSPTTGVPTTNTPTTFVPTITSPTTALPTAALSTTGIPTTASPTTFIPTTTSPTTDSPTTVQPTVTDFLTTTYPTTDIPTNQEREETLVSSTIVSTQIDAHLSDNANGSGVFKDNIVIILISVVICLLIMCVVNAGCYRYYVRKKRENKTEIIEMKNTQNITPFPPNVVLSETNTNYDDNIDVNTDKTESFDEIYDAVDSPTDMGLTAGSPGSDIEMNTIVNSANSTKVGEMDLIQPVSINSIEGTTDENNDNGSEDDMYIQTGNETTKGFDTSK